MSMSEKRNLRIAGCLLVLLLIGGCGRIEGAYEEAVGETPAQSAKAIVDAAQAAMQSDGINPVIAGAAVTLEYHEAAAAEHLDQVLAATQGPIEKLTGVSGLAILVISIVVKLVEALLRARGRQNLANVVSGPTPESKWSSVDAILLGGHSPPAVANENAKVVKKQARKRKAR